MCNHWLAEAERREDEAQRQPDDPEPKRVKCPVCVTSDLVESEIFAGIFECDHCGRTATLKDEKIVWEWPDYYQLDYEDWCHVLKLIIEGKATGWPKGYILPPMEAVA